MEIALFISLEQLKKYTFIGGNIESSKLIPALTTAQRLELEPILGTDLYDKINNDIINDTLADPYMELLNTYIQPMLYHFAVSYYLPYASYQMDNKGVSKWNGGDNNDSISQSELSFIINREESTARNYKQRLLDYLAANGSDFPEYYTNSGADVSPSDYNSGGGLFLD